MIIKKFFDLITNRDSIVYPSALKLHFDGDAPLKTLIGGTFSCLIDAYVIYISVT